ncbi:metalloprotease family protein [Lederbergia lenta]|uniref:metalloprotease family protein n=1 Tax=Lederbergia lenta TaxID=1467 RepID=UPI002041C796|nr:metalloprotease family protein [Lederbergia lenta]MCM3109968.1 DUF3267 domain-containing protein [Lederbergia lenta]
MKRIGEYKLDDAIGITTIIIILVLIKLYDIFVSNLSVKSIFAELNLEFIVLIILSLTFFIQHELIHFIVAKFLGYGKTTKLNITSISINDYIRKRDLVLIVLSPVIIITTLYIALAIIYDRFALLLLLVAALNFVGSKGDISLVSQALKFKGDVYIRENERAEAIHVYRKETI